MPFIGEGENMEILTLRDEYIKLGQAIKAAGFVGSGVEAKQVILRGDVTVNGETVLQRGKKCYDGDVISMDGKSLSIRKSQT